MCIRDRFDATEYVDLGGRTRAQRNFSKDELLVLAVPVYAGQMPAVPGLLDLSLIHI